MKVRASWGRLGGGGSVSPCAKGVVPWRGEGDSGSWVGLRLALHQRWYPMVCVTLPHPTFGCIVRLYRLRATQFAGDPQTSPRRRREGDTAVPVFVGCTRPGSGVFRAHCWLSSTLVFFSGGLWSSCGRVEGGLQAQQRGMGALPQVCWSNQWVGWPMASSFPLPFRINGSGRVWKRQAWCADGPPTHIICITP